MSETNGKWKTTNDEFRGYARAKFEEIHSDVREIREAVKAQADVCVARHGSLQDRVKNLEQIESNKKAVTKAFSFLWASVGGLVMWLGDKVWTLLSK